MGSSIPERSQSESFPFILICLYNTNLYPLPRQTHDGYGVTFDHLVPTDDPDPEVLQLNMIKPEDIDPCLREDFVSSINRAEYEGKKVLVVPRCCQKREGTTDRKRVNESVGIIRSPPGIVEG